MLAIQRKDLFLKNERIMFYHPKLGRVKAVVLSTEYTVEMGFTCTVLIDTIGLMLINEKFLDKLVLKAALNEN